MSIKKILCLIISVLSFILILGGTSVFAATVISYPDLPNAVKSPLYTVTVNGTPLFVEKLTKYSPEMQVHYAHCSLSGSGTANFTITCNESFNSYKLSPKSRNLSSSKSGNSVSFASGPNYLIFQPDSKELLFVLIDSEEVDPPKLGDSNVKNILDYGVDKTGQTLVTSKVQSAINEASGATKNILYFPPGRYKVGELWLKSNMTLYLAGGAILYGSDNTSDFNTGSGGVNIEGCSHGMIRMYKINNTKILGRGVIDGNGKLIRSKNDTKINLLKIEESSNILVDGIIVRDASFWNTLPYRSDKVTIKNYKMINCRPNSNWNNTDGVDFDESTNGYLYNAFLYTGDDNMAVKNEYDNSGTINTKNIVHEKIVLYSNSAGCKIGTKTMGRSMDDVVFRDIDVVKAGRATVIDAYDTAVISNTRFENVRIEDAGSIIALEENDPPSWRTCSNKCIIKDTYFINFSSDVKNAINLHGKDSSYNVNGVYFSNFSVKGNPVTSKTDSDASWNINSYVSNITFTTIANTAPVVDAGANSTFTLPSAIRLSGKASDDGLPSGSTLSTAWSLQSGPGTAAFEDIKALNTNATVSAAGTYVFKLTASDGTLSSSDTVTIIVNPIGTLPLIAYYKFDETSGTTVSDSSVLSNNAKLNGGAVWAAGQSENAVSLDGTSGYVSLPSGILSSANDVTISAWVKLNSLSQWARIFDFGTGTNTYMFLAPQSGDNKLKFAITTNGYNNEDQINAPVPMEAGSWKHITVTLSGNTGILYVDGVEVSRNSNMTLNPSSLGNTTQNYIGKSQFEDDPYLDGFVDDFRIYSKALDAVEVKTLFDDSKQSVYIYGDVTGDGAVDVTDYAAMKKYLLGDVSAMQNKDWKITGDLNQDGTIDVLDFAVFKKYLLGTITKLPYSI